MYASKPPWQSIVALALALSLVGAMSSVALAKPKASDPSLRGSWSLDEGTGTVAKDRSSYKNHGTVTDATWIDGRTGSALHFDGSYDYVRVPASESLEPPNVSLALWFRATKYDPDDYHWDWKVLAYKGLIKGKAASYSIKSSGDRASDNGLVFMVWDGQQNIYTPPVPGVWDGEWHHAVGTYDGKELRLYVDGSLESRIAWSGTIAYVLDGHIDYVHDDLIIGNPRPDEMKQAKQYRGDIDEVLIWDRALSASEVAKLAAPTGKKKPRR